MQTNRKKRHFTNLYNQEFDYVYAFIFTRTAGNGQLTEDIVQETFTAAWLSLDRFDNRSTYRTWLCAIAKNKLCGYYRAAIKREKFELQDDEKLVESAVNFDFEKMVFDHEMKLCVLNALNRISPLYRYALIMKYIDGLRVKEIARILKKSPKAVDGVLQRARVAFEKEFSKMEGSNKNYER